MKSVDTVNDIKRFLAFGKSSPFTYPNMKRLRASFYINGKADVVLVRFTFGGFHSVAPDGGAIAVFAWLMAIELLVELFHSILTHSQRASKHQQ